MLRYLAPLLLIALMGALSVFFLHILSRRPTIRTILLLPLGPDVAAELMLRESLHALSRLPCTVELTVALHDTSADRQALERISILQQEYPFLTVVSDEGLKALLCATEPDATPLFHG